MNDVKDVNEDEPFIENVYDCVGNYHLQYLMIISQDPLCAEKRFSTVYSLMIVKIAKDEDAETYFAYDVARSPETARSILCVMRDNTVTPCTAYEVLDEIL